ncbi:MAG: peptidoglycan DD-metalloendopeptidase family protein, partial [bacterium]
MAGMAFAEPVVPTPLGGPLHWPLAGADRALRGGLGDARNGRFHAGLDLSTARRNGASVAAPADGWVERVRTSGVGYGRSLYIRTDDGRLVVFGHLDAFEPRLAAYVDSVQRATVGYEQDLWPPVGRFRYRGGERVAWSGESGAGPPHLHVEVRHGDFALNPLLAGYAVPDAVAPRIASVTLEPLDES